MKCQFAECKLRVQLDVLCRCSKKFCPKHRMAEDHACTYDFKEEGRKALSEALVKVQAKKVILI